MLLVAVFPSTLLYFEDVEERFEAGAPGDDWRLANRGCEQLELIHALSRAWL